jgi:uncharacterized membrane protein
MGELTLLDFMREGGWGMWPILIFGLICVGTAVHFARRPSGDRLACVAASWVTTLCAVLHGMLTDAAAVFRALQDPQRVPDAMLVRGLFTGLKEASRPGALGGIFLTLAALCVTIGFFRGRRAEIG